MNQQHFAVIATQRAEAAFNARQPGPMRAWTPIAISDNKGGSHVLVKTAKTRAAAEQIALQVAFYAGVAVGSFGHKQERDPAVRIVKVSHLKHTGRGYRVVESITRP
jgi:hypothetical protein